jgi:hypothetical protein
MLKVKDKDTTWQFLQGALPIDLTPIIEEVISFKNEWLLDTSRQDKLATHKDTEMFQLRFISYYWELGQGNNSKEINSFKEVSSNKALKDIYSYLEEIYDSQVVRCEVIKMHKNSNIETHIDSGEFLNLGRRVHIPLITNKNVIFTVFNSKVNMEVGNWYEINNSLPHSVSNESDLDRTHLIIDLMPSKFLETL